MKMSGYTWKHKDMKKADYSDPLLSTRKRLWQLALRDLPRQVDGFDVVEWLIINDGCRDDTVKVARENGVDHIVNFK